MTARRAAALAVLLGLLGSCGRVGPMRPPGCMCGPPSVITRNATYAGDVPSLTGPGTTRVQRVVDSSGATQLTFTRGADTIAQSFSSMVLNGP